MDFGSIRLRIVSTPAPRVEGFGDPPRQHPARGGCRAPPGLPTCVDQSFDADSWPTLERNPRRVHPTMSGRLSRDRSGSPLGGLTRLSPLWGGSREPVPGRCRRATEPGGPEGNLTDSVIKPGRAAGLGWSVGTGALRGLGRRHRRSSARPDHDESQPMVHGAGIENTKPTSNKMPEDSQPAPFSAGTLRSTPAWVQARRSRPRHPTDAVHPGRGDGWVGGASRSAAHLPDHGA
jgi:hypothetical protein